MSKKNEWKGFAYYQDKYYFYQNVKLFIYISLFLLFIAIFGK